ncbi:MAG: cyclodeaminase/cyclohydrolase family protein [Halanaerobiales bacterium]
MINIIYNKSLKELGKLTSSDNSPVPAAGTSAAVNGFLGVSLLKLVFKVSKINLDREELKKINEKLKKAEKEFLNLMEKDIEAFQKNKDNNFQKGDKLKLIIKTPLAIAQTAEDIIILGNNYKDKVKNNVSADYKTAMANLQTAQSCALIIVKSNYKFFLEKSPFLEKIKAKVNKLEN